MALDAAATSLSPALVRAVGLMRLRRSGRAVSVLKYVIEESAGLAKIRAAAERVRQELGLESAYLRPTRYTVSVLEDVRDDVDVPATDPLNVFVGDQLMLSRIGGQGRFNVIHRVHLAGPEQMV
jgi:uncharacterized protein (UPF0147 family)